MLIGYARVSKADGRQLFDLQLDALLGAGVAEERIYEGSPLGHRDPPPGMAACLKPLQRGITVVARNLHSWGKTLTINLLYPFGNMHRMDITSTLGLWDLFWY